MCFPQWFEARKISTPSGLHNSQLLASLGTGHCHGARRGICRSESFERIAQVARVMTTMGEKSQKHCHSLFR